MSLPQEISYDFSAPSQVVFGWGRRREVGGLARSLGRRAFVVCGSQTLETNGILDEIGRSLRESGVESVRAATISREPLVEDVDRSLKFLREQRAGPGDLLLAVGGGSAIDLAKATGAVITQASTASVLEYLEGVGTGLKIVDTPLPVLAMPTTAGTGSEATRNAVISSSNPPFKKSLRSNLMVPRIALIDPELTVSVPPHITAWTGMDAITQLLESYISRRATPATQHISLRGLELAFASLGEAFCNGQSHPAREAMAQAALLSGMALANSGLGMAHGVAAALGVHCQVPHGLACAIMLPATLQTNMGAEGIEMKFGMIGALMHHSNRLPTEAASDVMTAEHEISSDGEIRLRQYAQEVVPHIEGLLNELKIPRRLSEVGVRRAQIPDIVRDSRGNSMSGNPRTLSDDELTRILENLL